MSSRGSRRRDARLVAIGDLHGGFEALRAILHGTGLVDGDLGWCGGSAHLVQTGDVFNRQDEGRACFELLMGLQREAPEQGGKVTVLLGNHEVMTADGVEAYCPMGEYLAFAPSREREAWPERVHRAMARHYRRKSADEIVPPLGPRVDAWIVENVPGRKELRRAFGPRGRVGRVLRRLPVAARAGDLAFVHAGLPAYWAKRGLDGLNRSAEQGWEARDAGDRERFRASAIGDHSGPLWYRRQAEGRGPMVERSLSATLRLLGAERLLIGHTQTRSLEGGEPGHILLRFDGRLVCLDVGMRDENPQTWAALVVDRSGGREWKPSGWRRLWP
jgi:hypothetical protein